MESLAFSTNDISLWVDCYDDLFSDFDLRPFTSRNISDDFLREVKKLSHESDLHVDNLVLYLPKNIRDKDSEAIITRRLHNHFTKNLHFFKKKRKAESKRDLLLSLLGLSMMLTAGYISSSGSRNIWIHVLLVVFEPAGWFLVWINLEHLINSSRREKPELEFYLKLSKCKIFFSDR